MGLILHLHQHRLAGERPLLMTELGLDSLRHGEDGQARSLAWQVRTSFAAGCAGTFVYAWTDEWHRGGADVQDWAFGITRSDRTPKPALATVERAFRDVPFPAAHVWPRISIVICTYNGSRTLRDCLEGTRRLEYPDYEVIVVDDGSTDATASLVRQHPRAQLVTIPHSGLGVARNDDRPFDQEGEKLALQGLRVLDYSNAACREDQQRQHLLYHNSTIAGTDAFLTPFGGHLRRRRLQLKLHQWQAAQKLNVSTVTLSRWECDKVIRLGLTNLPSLSTWATIHSPIQPSEGPKATKPQALPFYHPPLPPT